MRAIHIPAFAALAAFICSCSTDMFERTINIGSGLGFPEKVVTLEAAEGERTIAVLATQEYTISSDASWLNCPATGQEGREGFVMHYSANDSFPRVATVVVAIDEHSHFDTLTVRQRGAVAPALTVKSPSITVRGSSGGEFQLSLDTNLPDDAISLTWAYDEGAAWFEEPQIKGSALHFKYSANPESHTRRGSITASYSDAFGNLLTIPFQLIQLSNSDSAGKDFSLQEFCSLASEEGTPIVEDATIEGIVVSDKENGNCGDNTQTSTTTIDYSVCRRTVYLESTDGSRGLCLITVSPDDNIFRQGDRVKLSVRGATLYRSTVVDALSDPVFYTLKGVKGSMALETEHLGRSGIPVKEKYIGALTDDDIFTYVTIKDCELPVRKGPLTPVSEQFTSEGGSDKVSKFGILLHDVCGGSMYLYTNTTCPYRRDGSVLPQGSGTVSGVVVHELYPRFSYMDNSSSDSGTWGNIGRYQLRHTTREDINLARTMQERSFSAILCEWRYVPDKNLQRYYATDGDTQAYFEYSFVYPDSYTDGRAGTLPINKRTDYSYLGPVGASNAGNRSGLGVTLADGTDWMGPEYNGFNSEFAANINSDGLGKVPADVGSAWSTNLTARNGKPMYTQLVFSTKGITSSLMSMQISSMNFFYGSTQKINGVPMYLQGPRYWEVQYSTDGTTWKKAGGYNLPEFCQTTPMTQLWQTAGFKPVNIPLPAAELLDRDKVWIRIIPEESMVSGSQTEYLDYSIKYPSSGSFPTAWNYIGIRYNTVEPASSDFGGGGIDPVNPIDYNW